MNYANKIISSHERELNVFGVAGAGKTEFAKNIALAAENLRILYLSFGKENTLSAKKRMPHNVDCFSFHSFAFKMTGISKNRIIPKLTIRDAKSSLNEVTKDIHSMAALEAFTILLVRFCESRLQLNEALKLLNEKGVYPTLTIEEKAAAYNALRLYFKEAFRDGSKIPVTHGAYLKRYSMGETPIRYDIVLIDEAQDLNPAMFSLASSFIRTNPGLKIIKMGDPMQQIFKFIGASSEFIGSKPHLTMKRSRRFGEPLASFINKFGKQSSPCGFNAIIGNGSNSFVMHAPSAKHIKQHIGQYKRTAVVARYNATLWNWMRLITQQEITFHLVGGLLDKELQFIAELHKLYSTGKSNYPTLKGITFSTFKKNAALNDSREQILAVRFIESIKDGGTFIRLVKKLHRSADDADMLLSTVHQSKGLQFPYVWIGGDHKNLNEGFSQDEFNIAYTALTRAQKGVFLPSAWDI